MSGWSAFSGPIEKYFGGPWAKAYTVTEYLDHEQSAYWLYEAIEPKSPAINLTGDALSQGRRRADEDRVGRSRHPMEHIR